MVSEELLEMLRCPACVSGPTRKETEDPGRLELVNGVWLVCREHDCNRKYPIIDDIPRMLVEIGDKHAETPVEALGEARE